MPVWECTRSNTCDRRGDGWTDGQTAGHTGGPTHAPSERDAKTRKRKYDRPIEKLKGIQRKKGRVFNNMVQIADTYKCFTQEFSFRDIVTEEKYFQVQLYLALTYIKGSTISVIANVCMKKIFTGLKICFHYRQNFLIAV